MLSSEKNVLMKNFKKSSFLKVSFRTLISQDLKVLLVRYIVHSRYKEEEHMKSSLNKFKVNKI